MKTIGIDIKHLVFNNETEATMYVTKDIDSESFIVAIPVITFAWEIQDERDYDYLLRYNVFGDEDKRMRLVQAIKVAIAEFDEVLG